MARQDREGLFTTHPLFALTIMCILIGVPMLAVAFLLGVPWKIAIAAVAGSTVLCAIASYRLLTHPDDPGAISRVLRRIFGP